jgi:thymidylate synthase
MEVQSTNAKDLWMKALQLILSEGEEYTDKDGRICKEIMNLQLILKNPSSETIEQPIDIITNFQDWIYPSKEELTSVMFKEVQTPTYEHTYGGRIFLFGNVKDQLREFVFPALKKNHLSRRAVVAIYNPLVDSDLTNKNTPALMYLQFRIKEGKLLLTANLRSNDILMGWPANIYQLFKLQEFVAKEMNTDIGSLTVISNSAHVFLERENPLFEKLKL